MDWSLIAKDLAAFVQVVFIDVALAGDNAVVVGMAVAGIPAQQQRLAILVGIGGATILRIALGAVALHLLQIVGLVLAGGLLLLWVAWRMYRELRAAHRAPATAQVAPKSLRQAMLQILLADVSMSLDNVLAVAGAAQGRFWILATGLVLSIVLMGVAAGLIARILERTRWVAWAGLAIVLYVALRMIWDGSHQVATAVM